MIIGIAGTFASGKGVVVDYLKEKGFAHYSSSNTLKEILDTKGLPHTRENLSAAAEALLAEYPGGVLEMNLQSAEKAGQSHVVLESVHRMSETDFIRSRGGKILGVDADVAIRYERAQNRGEGVKDFVTFEQFKIDMAREEEGKGSITSNINEVIQNADHVIMNDGTLEALHTQINKILERMM
jgi:dephospho-CoA kinase